MIRTITFRKIWNYLIMVLSYWLSVLLKKPLIADSPSFLTIEPVNFCNLKCPECPSGMDILSRSKGKMDILLFKKIVLENFKTLIYLNLYFQGEPFLNDDIFKMIHFAREKNIFTEASTNGHFLDSDSCRKIIDSGLNSLIISLDGLDSKTYEKYRKGGDFNKVIEGIGNLVNMKNRHKSKTPFIKLQFLVLKHNEHQVKKLKAESKKLGVDKLIIKSAQVYDFENALNILPLDDRYSRYKYDKGGKFVIKHKQKNRCFKMWSSCVITWDGNIVPCCFDKDAEYKFGNINLASLNSVWKSKSYNNFRMKLIQNRKKINICCNCSE
jgi:radical SAM protein with 4Fe4S-binding SPASM domain